MSGASQPAESQAPSRSARRGLVDEAPTRRRLVWRILGGSGLILPGQPLGGPGVSCEGDADCASGDCQGDGTCA